MKRIFTRRIWMVMIIVFCTVIMQAQHPLSYSESRQYFVSVRQDVFSNSFSPGYMTRGYGIASVLFQFVPKSSRQSVSFGPCYTNNGDIGHSMYGGAFNYRATSGRDESPHVFVVNVGINYLRAVVKTEQEAFTHVYAGAGYMYVFGKKQEWYINPGIQLSYNALHSFYKNASSSSGPHSYSPDNTYGYSSPGLTLELGYKIR